MNTDRLLWIIGGGIAAVLVWRYLQKRASVGKAAKAVGSSGATLPGVVLPSNAPVPVLQVPALQVQQFGTVVKPVGAPTQAQIDDISDLVRAL